MGKRIDLQSVLEELLGSENVYFQPPESKKISYPCIIYSRNDVKTQFANDKPYNYQTQYNLIVIDKDPDSVILDKVVKLPMCVFDRHYVADNLNHDVFNLYY